MKKCNPKRIVLTKCAYCGIVFLTGPSNRGRDDLYCPFGCREKRKREKAKERCKKYRMSKKGKSKKKKLNKKRYLIKNNEEKEAVNLEEDTTELEGSFSHYIGFLLKALLLDPEKNGIIYKIYKLFKKKNKKARIRDSAP